MRYFLEENYRMNDNLSMIRQNLHTHCTYCDGKNTLEEMVLAAIDKGFSSLGFSSHCFSNLSYDECGIKSAADYEAYLSELEALKEKYKNQISIYRGIELESRIKDELYPNPDPRLDYSIGSIHWFYLDSRHWEVDYKAELLLQAKESFGGFRPLIESYYNEVIEFAKHSSYSITGHIDLVTKFSELNSFGFENESWYRDAALSAAESVVKTGKLVEVNTGAISRGYRTTPYPAPFILKRLAELNAPIIVTTDCHSANNIDIKYDETVSMLSSYGFTHLYYLTDSGFKGIKIDA